MRIVERAGDAGVGDAFTDVPRIVYRDDPQWIPEDAAAVERAFSPANDWHRTGAAATFTVEGRARIAAFRADGFTLEGRAAAYFGYWEHADDEAGIALLGAAEEWASARGAEVLYGPVDFTTLGSYRLRVSAEPDAVTFPGEPYNPQRYVDTITGAGYGVARRYVTQLGRIGGEAKERRAVVAAQVTDAGYVIEPLDGATWRALLPEIKPVADEIFAENFGFTPVSYAQFAAGYAEAVARRMCPHTSRLVRGPDGAIVGFVLVYPHYGPLVVQGAGDGRVDVAALDWATHWPTLEARGECVGIGRTVGVLPAHRGKGLLAAIGHSVTTAGAERYDRWVAALVREDNVSRRFGAPHAEAERWYALYRRELART